MQPDYHLGVAVLQTLLHIMIDEVTWVWPVVFLDFHLLSNVLFRQISKASESRSRTGFSIRVSSQGGTSISYVFCLEKFPFFTFPLCFFSLAILICAFASALESACWTMMSSSLEYEMFQQSQA